VRIGLLVWGMCGQAVETASATDLTGTGTGAAAAIWAGKRAALKLGLIAAVRNRVRAMIGRALGAGRATDLLRGTGAEAAAATWVGAKTTLKAGLIAAALRIGILIPEVIGQVIVRGSGIGMGMGTGSAAAAAMWVGIGAAISCFEGRADRRRDSQTCH
jgi:hypothetical protein